MMDMIMLCGPMMDMIVMHSPDEEGVSLVWPFPGYSNGLNSVSLDTTYADILHAFVYAFKYILYYVISCFKSILSLTLDF